MILLFTSFMICLAVSTLNGKWGVRCQVFLMIHAGLFFGKTGLERLYFFLNESQHSLSALGKIFAFILAGALMMLFALTIGTPNEPDVKTKDSVFLVAAASITGLIIGLMGFFWLAAIPLALRIWEVGAQWQTGYSRGGPMGLFLVLGLLLLSGILIPAIVCLVKRKRLALLLARRLIYPGPRKLHPAFAALIILVIIGLYELLI